MDRIPAEIKYKILRSALGVFKDQPHAFMRTRKTVCCLSNEWRALGLSDPVIWSHVFVSPRIGRADILRQSARCSSDLDVYVELLDMDLDPAFLAWFTDNIAPLLLRCRELTIVSPYTPPSVGIFRTISSLDGSSIQRIRLDFRPVPLYQQWMNTPVQPMFRGLLPKLQSLSMRRNFLLPSAMPFLQPIRELHLSSLNAPYIPSVETMLEILRSAPSLANIRLKDVDFSGWKTSSRPLPVLKYLTHLAIISLPMGVVDVFSLVTMPALHTFHLEYNRDDPIGYMHIAWSDIFLGVTTAIVRTHSWDHAEFEGVLRRFSAAERVDIRNNDHMLTAAFQHIILTRQGLLPNAEIIFLPSWVPLSNADDMLTNPSRQSGAPGMRLVTPVSLFNLTEYIEYYTAIDSTVAYRPITVPEDLWA
ncbi:hypothetical protein B0H16DRAFT_1728909 [Mycena metata]|uniref:F-box domain-containing protein n=1 Tax=Mycena metata TaxID=1033252 RepID=A0AAD7IEK3_9AGAR|nr:hypothetical protein B0H16DRAFT_1728909 [Mycena metata]